MKRYNNTAVVQFDTESDGNAASGATVTVRNSTSGVKATIYSDNGVTELSNPFNTDNQGNYGFFVDNGTYNIIINEGLPSQNIIPDEEIVSSNPIETIRFFDTIRGGSNAAEDSTALSVGDAVEVKEVTAGNGGGSSWDVVPTSSVTPNGDNIVISVANPLISLVQRKQGQVNGAIDRKYSVVAGVVRNSGSGWFIIDDSNHRNSNIASVSAQPDGTLQINYTREYDRIVSLVAAPDETLASKGVMIGGSVGRSLAVFNIAANLKFFVNSSDGSVDIDPVFAPYVSANVSTASEIVITHPTMVGSPVVTGLGSSGRSRARISFNPTTTVIQELCDIGGYFQYNGTDWEYLGDMLGEPTAVFSNGILTITHPEAFDNVTVNVTGRDGIIAQVGSTGTTSIEVKFYDFTGTQIMTPNTNMRFHFRRNGTVQAKEVGGLYSVQLGTCTLNANNFVSSSGNFWFNGVFENDSSLS